MSDLLKSWEFNYKVGALAQKQKKDLCRANKCLCVDKKTNAVSDRPMCTYFWIVYHQLWEDFFKKHPGIWRC